MSASSQMTTSGKFFGTVAAVAVVDQLLKVVIRNLLSEDIQLIPGFLSLINTTNTGAGFGILQGYRIFLIAATIFFLYLVYRYYPSLKKNQIIPVALVTGGAIGNLVDRIFLGGVTDYINFSFWPAFNLADSAITIGAVWLVLLYIRKK